jgi:hypothetical protein
MIKKEVDNREIRFGRKFMKYGKIPLPMLEEFSIIVEPNDMYTKMVLWSFPVEIKNGWNIDKGYVHYKPVEKVEHGRNGKVEIRFQFMEIEIKDYDDV